MSELDKIIMLSLAVSDMAKSKKFYETKLGFKVVTDYGQGDAHWVSLELPDGGTTITLTTARENMEPGTLKLYVSTEHVEAAHKQLASADPSDIADDLYGPGSGVKWFSLDDPDGNKIMIVSTRK